MTQGLLSWGRYPAHLQHPITPQWRDEVPDTCLKHQPGLAFGNGRSYGDVCLASNNRVLDMRQLNGILHFDRVSGTIRAEAGITLYDLLSVIVPAGWFLPVVPGTGLATLGGAIANDVHGKNHHRNGTFGCHVSRLALFRNGSIVECSPVEQPQLFAATIAGLGLSGVILWAEIRLQPVQTSQMDNITERFQNLSEFFTLADRYDPSHEYGVAWIDCLASGSQRGRGVYFAANHARYSDDSTWHKRPLCMPLTPPLSLVNQWSLKAFNFAYWHTKPAKPKRSRVAYQPFFFPLDSIHHWNRMYGPKGFQQYQCVIPRTTEQDAIAELLKQINDARQGSFLAVLKRCGQQPSPGLLSFPIEGTSLALDFPNPHRLESLFNRLDRIVREAGGRLYPAKDAHMQGSDFRHFYPQWEQIEACRANDINSHFWHRVTR